MKVNSPSRWAAGFPVDESDVKSIRIRPELRAAQVKRSFRMVPALTLYFGEKYDLGKTSLPGSFRKVGLIECLRIIASSNAQVLEVPEPLWLRFAPKNFLLLATWKLSGLLKSGRKFSVAYAIENNDIKNLLSPRAPLSPIVERIFSRLAGAAIRLSIDRIAFGSSASMNVYHSLPGVKRIEHRLIPELPSRDPRASERAAKAAPTMRAVFVGELDDRKGIQDVMKAWPSVEGSLPEAVLTVVGGGKHAALVEQWCRERPESRLFCGFLAHEETARQLSEADVLIAPSRRAGRWKEQIGLPIVEGLSVGLTVVTTDETGLADWLSREEHTVLSETDVERQLAGSITHALEQPISREKVLQSLPAIPGRIAADAWLHEVQTPSAPRTLK